MPALPLPPPRKPSATANDAPPDPIGDAIDALLREVHQPGAAAGAAADTARARVFLHYSATGAATAKRLVPELEAAGFKVETQEVAMPISSASVRYFFATDPRTPKPSAHRSTASCPAARGRRFWTSPPTSRSRRPAISRSGSPLEPPRGHGGAILWPTSSAPPRVTRSSTPQSMWPVALAQRERNVEIALAGRRIDVGRGAAVDPLDDLESRVAGHDSRPAKRTPPRHPGPQYRDSRETAGDRPRGRACAVARRRSRD